MESAGADRSDDGGLVGITLAGHVAFDGSYRHALIGNTGLFAPRCQGGEEAGVDMRRIRAGMFPHFFEVHGIDAASIDGDLIDELRNRRYRIPPPS